MTVQELIELLQTYPTNALVVTEGYENGYEPIKKIELIKVEENKKNGGMVNMIKLKRVWRLYLLMLNRKKRTKKFNYRVIHLYSFNFANCKLSTAN